MEDQLEKDFELMRDDVFISVNALIIQSPSYTSIVLPAPAPVTDPDMNSVGNINCEIIKLIQQL